jgi:hypothetical protein
MIQTMWNIIHDEAALIISRYANGSYLLRHHMRDDAKFVITGIDSMGNVRHHIHSRMLLDGDSQRVFARTLERYGYEPTAEIHP